METILYSLAYNPPTKDPMDVPPIMSTGIPCRSKLVTTPTWDIPLEPPPPKTRPTASLERIRANLIKSSLYIFNTLLWSFSLTYHLMCCFVASKVDFIALFCESFAAKSLINDFLCGKTFAPCSNFI